MLNDYNQRAASKTNSELDKAKAELAENQRKVSGIIKMVTEAGISIETVNADLMTLEQQKQYLEGYIRELEAENKANSISEEQVREIIRKSGDFIRTHNVAECRNFIDSYIERVIVYDDRADIIFKVNVFDKVTGTVSQMKSEGTKEAVENSYYAKKWSGTGQKTGGKSEVKPAVSF